MKRETKFIGNLGLLLLLSAAFAQPAAGAEQNSGWQKEGEEWVYLKPDGSKTSESWVTEDGVSYYFGEDGYMVRDSIIEIDGKKYYVDEEGVKVKNRWISRPNEDYECDQEVSTLWYYFDRTGRACAGENKRLRYHDGVTENIYYFDPEGHMLSGWQKIGDATYYLGGENQGHVHKLWQYLEPDDEMSREDGSAYDSLEQFYFGYNGKLVTNSESYLGNEHFHFDENGVMVKGWFPGIHTTGLGVGVNRFYDETTGIRAKGWFYASDPDDPSGDAHWFYAEKHTGEIYNEGGKDSEGSGLAYQSIGGATYFFDPKGHMITGLISTSQASLGDVPFTVDEFQNLSGDIEKKDSNIVKRAGIYYLSLEENTLGQLQRGKRLCLKDDNNNTYYYELSSTGRAYQNALIRGCIYGDNGIMLHSDSGWELFVIEQPVYDKGDYLDNGELREDAVPTIPEGSQVVINQSGKVKKNGTVKVQGVAYQVENYVVTQE